MMRWASRQRGMTLIGWMAVLAVGAFFLMIFFRLFPVYMEFFAVQSSLQSLASDAEARSPAEIRDKLSRRLQINDVERVNQKAVKIEQQGGKYEVRVAYEVRVPFVYNIDFVVSFDEKAEVPAS